MTEQLSPTARALVDAARDGLGPDAATIRRMRANITTAVGGGAAAAGSVAAGKTALGIKLAILAVVAGAIVGVVALTRGPGSTDVAAPIASTASSASSTAPRESAPTPAPSTDRATHRPFEQTAEHAATHAVEHVDEHVDDRVDSAAIEIEAPQAATAPSTTAAPSTNAAPPDKAKPQLPQADLAREVALVDRAMAALRDGDPAGALSATHRYDIETRGKGQLAEDAAAIAVEALCLRDDAAASGKLAAFDARWPHSAQRARVRATCKR